MIFLNTPFKRKIWKTAHFANHYFWLLVILVFCIFPYFWMFMTSVKPRELLLVYPPVWIPNDFDFSHYLAVFYKMPFFLYLKNSLFVAMVTTLFCILIASLSGYAISRIKFQGKKYNKNKRWCF